MEKWMKYNLIDTMGLVLILQKGVAKWVKGL